MQEAGLYTAWKFSRNRSNLHLIGGSSLRGRMVFQNTLLGYDCPYSISAFKSSKRKILNFLIIIFILLVHTTIYYRILFFINYLIFMNSPKVY